MKFLLTLFLAASLTSTFADRTAASPDMKQTAGNYYCYPYMVEDPPALTDAPEGYEAFHLEHYGRHGSRHLIGDSDYNVPVELLSKAEGAGKLTPLGEKVLAHVKQVGDQATLRDGDLTDNGARQHNVIGRRMATRFPSIFRPGANVDAKATTVIRCILSMHNGLKGIMEVAPDVNTTADASRAEMYYMNFDDRQAWAVKDSAEKKLMKEFAARHANKGEYLSKLFTDPDFARDSIGETLFEPLFYVLQNAQSHEGQDWLAAEVFTPEEAREQWLIRNAGWFIHGGDSNLTERRMPYTQVKLLRNIIESTDSALLSPTPGANLRYGHDGIVLPLITLMDIDGYGEVIDDLEELATKGWADYELVPMATNVQLIFYRPAGTTPASAEETLVKVLLNEKEATLPLSAVSGPYYRYSDFRRHYLDKIAPYEK